MTEQIWILQRSYKSGSGSGSGKSEQESVPHFLLKMWKPGSFWTFHVVVMQNNGKEMYKTVRCN